MSDFFSDKAKIATANAIPLNALTSNVSDNYATTNNDKFGIKSNTDTTAPSIYLYDTGLSDKKKTGINFNRVAGQDKIDFIIDGVVESSVDSSGFNLSGNVSLNSGALNNLSLKFINDVNTGLYRSDEDTIMFATAGIERLGINTNSVDVGTATNNLNLVVNGNSSATRFRAGDGIVGTPSYSFTTGNGQDCGMYYDAPGGNDRLNFAVNGSTILQLGLSTGVSNLYNKILLNSGSSTNPAVAINSTSFGTGFSGDASNNLWTLTNGNINTTHTLTSFDVGRTNLNNTNLRTLNANGPSNFNTFSPTYTNIINTQITGNRTDGNWFGIDYNPTTGVYIIGSNGSGTGIVRAAVSASNNLTTWTTYNETTFAYGNMRHVAFGPTPNIWIVGTSSSVQRNFYYSTNTTNWTLVSDTGGNIHFATARAYNKLKWINGQFVGLSSGSNVAFSTDGINWTLRQINATSYTLNDIVYSTELRMYVITTTTGAVLYWNDTTGTGITASTTFTAQTSNVYASTAVAWSPKISMFIIQNTSVNTQWASSSDGINWRTYTTTALNQNNGRLEWIPDFGGFFVGCQAATNANSIVSRDGITWTQINLTISGQSRGFYYNSSQKVFVFGLDGNLTFKNALTDFNNYVDSDNIYNTFNSNTRFIDTIEYQNQLITTVSGNNHYTLSQFNRSEVIFDTTSVNANIYLQGSSYNGRVGSKFKFIKSNTNNNVRIHGYETCNIVSQTGNVNNFNSQSTPLTYTILPSGYFGSFNLTRLSDDNNGVWLIDNIIVFSSSGVKREITEISTASNLTVGGLLSGTLNNIKYSLQINTGDFTIDATTAKYYNFYTLPGSGLTRTITFGSITSLDPDTYNGFTITLQRERFDAILNGTVSFLNSSGRQLAFIEWDNGVDNSQIITNNGTKTTNAMLTYIAFYKCYLVKNPSDNLLNWYVRDIGE